MKPKVSDVLLGITSVLTFVGIGWFAAAPSALRAQGNTATPGPGPGTREKVAAHP